MGVSSLSAKCWKDGGATSGRSVKFTHTSIEDISQKQKKHLPHLYRGMFCNIIWRISHRSAMAALLFVGEDETDYTAHNSNASV